MRGVAPLAARPWACGGLRYGANPRSHASRAPGVRGTAAATASVSRVTAAAREARVTGTGRAGHALQWRDDCRRRCRRLGRCTQPFGTEQKQGAAGGPPRCLCAGASGGWFTLSGIRRRAALAARLGQGSPRSTLAEARRAASVQVRVAVGARAEVYRDEQLRLLGWVGARLGHSCGER
jgi:hypothetical protein